MSESKPIPGGETVKVVYETNVVLDALLVAASVF